MKFNTILASLMLVLSSILISCGGGNSSAPVADNSGQSAASDPGASLPQIYSSDLQITVQIMANGTNLLAGFPVNLQFSIWDGTVTVDFTCVTVNNKGTGGNKDVVYTFGCPAITGTLEIKNTQGTGDTVGSTFEVITNLSLTDPKKPANTATINSDSSYTVGIGVVTVASQFDTKITDSTDNYEVKGNSTVVVAPDLAQLSSGTVQVNSSLQYLKDGAQAGTYTITSSNLAYTDCGLDAGSITYNNGTNTYVLAYLGCGEGSLTKNGVPIILVRH